MIGGEGARSHIAATQHVIITINIASVQASNYWSLILSEHPCEDSLIHSLVSHSSWSGPGHIGGQYHIQTGHHEMTSHSS